MPCQLRRRLGSDLRKPPERLQHFAPCDAPTSHPAMSQLRTLRCPNFAPCDVLTSHPAKFQVRTLRSFKFAPCKVLGSHRAKFARRLGVPVHRLVGYVRELGRAAMSAEMRAPLAAPIQSTKERAGYWRRPWRCRQIYVRKSKKYSMDGNAEAEPCTRKLAWFRSATCMVGLRNLHGSARRSAWFDFSKCMVPLPALHGWTKNATPYGPK